MTEKGYQNTVLKSKLMNPLLISTHRNIVYFLIFSILLDYQIELMDRLEVSQLLFN